MEIKKIQYCYALANDLEIRGETASANFVRRLLREREELLEALQQLVSDWESVGPLELVPDEINTDEHWDAARAAIAKATSR